MFKFFFFPKPYSYPIKIIEKIWHKFCYPPMGITCFGVADKRRTKKQMQRKLSLVSGELKYSG
jgi:hypothetical protein